MPTSRNGNDSNQTIGYSNSARSANGQQKMNSNNHRMKVITLNAPVLRQAIDVAVPRAVKMPPPTTMYAQPDHTLAAPSASKFVGKVALAIAA
jgi:hypothetical protein